MKVITDLKKDLDPEYDLEFKYQHVEFKNDYHLKTFLEKAFEINVKRSYVSYPEDKLHPKGDTLDWGGRTIIIVLKSGKIVELINSEWARINIIKPDKRS